MKNIFISRPVVLMLAVLFTASFIWSGCNMSRAAKGGAIGTGAGAVIGGVIGKQAGNTVLGAIIGAAVGGTAGALIGRYMDKQAEELQRDLKGAKVERVGEGIRITFDSGILFTTDSYTLTPEAKKNIEELARVLKKYDDTNILVEGHTDNTGSDSHNQTLSEKRAEAVANYASTLGVQSTRFSKQGYGETQPVGDNTTEAGRRDNRRVEIAIMANEKLKKAAEKGEI